MTIKSRSPSDNLALTIKSRSSTRAEALGRDDSVNVEMTAEEERVSRDNRTESRSLDSSLRSSLRRKTYRGGVSEQHRGPLGFARGRLFDSLRSLRMTEFFIPMGGPQAHVTLGMTVLGLLRSVRN